MRHRNRRSRLSIMTAHRKAMMRSMVQNLFKYQRIETTLARAKETRRLAERLITTSKVDSVAARRKVYASIPDRDLVKKLFTEITPLFKERTSGFTRIIITRYRRGDGATLAFIELTEKKIVEKHPRKKKAAASAAASAAAKPEEATASQTEKTAETPTVQEEAMGEKKKEPKQKVTSDERQREDKGKRAKKAEDKKVSDQKGLIKNLRGFFKRKDM